LTQTLSPWKIRGVQLDIARQMETVDYICRFTDFIAEHGYNLLVLYLEGRIKTKTFPYLAESESYTPYQMQKVVKYAAGKGIDVMPVVSTLGHAGLFLDRPELGGLGELRDGRAGRIKEECAGWQDVFCPSLPETYEFLEAYLTEIAEIFPCEYFHAGCDEAWDIGYCQLCRNRAEEAEGEAGLFAKHLADVHRIVTEKLGKRMLIWDDLFEHYESALHKIPTDIILCSWHYGSTENPPLGHFSNRRREDVFAKYGKLGFDYIFATREQLSSNIISFTDYARRYNALGGIVTTWEKTNLMLEEYLPNIALAGRLWYSGSTQDAKDKAEAIVKKILDTEDQQLADTVCALQSISPLPQTYNLEAFLCGPMNARKRERSLFASQAKNLLCRHLPNIPAGEARDVVEGLIVRTGTESLQYRLLDLSYRVYAGLNGLLSMEISALKTDIQSCIEEINRLSKLELGQWNKHRPGIAPRELSAKWHALSRSFERLQNILTGNEENTGMLSIGFFLPDAYSSQTTEILVQEDGSQEWVSIAKGVFKPELATESESAYYTRFFPIPRDLRIDRCRIDTYGYGGQGFTFIEVVNASGRRVPHALGNICGHVENPENLLIDDLQWCFMGERNTSQAFQNRETAKAVHSVVVEMYPVEKSG
jgi:hypothetical protein